MLGFFRRLLGKNEPVTPGLKTKKTSLKQRLNASQNRYKAVVVMYYEDKPLRKFETVVSAHGKDAVVKKVNEGLTFKVERVDRVKNA